MVSVAVNTIEGLVGAADVRAVLLGARAAGVLRFFAVFGEVTPMLAFETSDGFFFVFM